MMRKSLKIIKLSSLVLIFAIGFIYAMPSIAGGQDEIYPRGNVFPLGLYAVIQKSDMEVAKNAGFNLVHIYDSGMTVNSARAYLQAAQEVGIKVKMNMPSTHYYDNNDDFWIDYVKACAEYSSLAWWYIPEETYDHSATSRLVNIIKTYDPKNRPASTYSARYSELKNFMDVIDVMEGGIYYPYDKEPRVAIKVWIDETVENADEGDIAVNVPQLFGFGGGCPEAKDVRHDAYLGLVAGAKGLDWYAYYYVDHDGCYETWNEVKQIVYEMGGQSQEKGVNPDPLGPVILSPDIHQTINMEILSGPAQVQGPSWGKQKYYSSVNWLQKEYNDATYLIAVNSAESAVEVRFSDIPRGVSEVNVLFEGREIEVNDGSFTDSFNKIDVHVYKIG
jgi:hypothetical protein